MATIKHISITPKGGDVLELLKLFEEKARTEDISLPEVEIDSDELLEKFSKQTINSLISMHLLRIDR